MRAFLFLRVFIKGNMDTNRYEHLLVNTLTGILDEQREKTRTEPKFKNGQTVIIKPDYSEPRISKYALVEIDGRQVMIRKYETSNDNLIIYTMENDIIVYPQHKIKIICDYNTQYLTGVIDSAYLVLLSKHIYRVFVKINEYDAHMLVAEDRIEEIHL